MSGTVNISRDIWNDAAFRDQPFTEREAFMWMVMEASWKPRERRIGSISVHLERGQLATSVRFMADAWKWQKSTVDRFLKRLKNRDMIGTASGTGVNIITICKYDEYQGKLNSSGTPKKQKAGQQRDSSGTNEKKGVIREYTEEEDTDVSSLSPDSDETPIPNPETPESKLGNPEPKPFDEVAEAVSAYNRTANVAGWPKVQVISKQRRANLKARLAEAGGLSGWEDALAKARASPHCCGQNDRGWTASFDFLTRQSSFAKLMEGNYDDRNHQSRIETQHGRNGSGSKAGMVAAFAAVATRRTSRAG